MGALEIIGIVLGCLLFTFFLIIFILVPKKAYFSALFSGSYVSAFKLISLKLQKHNFEEIVSAYISAKKSKTSLSFGELEKISLSGGHPKNVMEGLVASKNAKLNLSLDFIKAIDIAGRDALQVVQECLNPKVMELPLILGVAGDQREVNVKISLTLKTNIEKFLSGVTEETISARAVEAVVTKISNTEFANKLTSRPELLDKAIFDAEIDSDAKYTLVSADVIHIDLGNDRSFASEKQLIEKEHILSMNKIEERKKMTELQEREVKIKIEEEKLKLIEEEAQVPRAIVEAINSGKIKDVVDYYKLQNLQADTEMRKLMSKNYKNNKF